MQLLCHHFEILEELILLLQFSILKLDWNGEFDSNILIRSFLIKNKQINIYAGCGIVIDSNPEEEINELKWKLLPLIDSLK